MMKNIWLMMGAGLLLGACITPPPNPAPQVIPPIAPPQVVPPIAPPQVNLQEIQLNTTLDANVNELVDWRFAFAATPDGGGSGERVFSYGSAESLRTDTLHRLGWMPNIKNPQKVADTMAQRAAKQVDFNFYDLVVVQLMDGGPPFGQFRYTSIGSNAIEFCIDRAPNPSGVSGMALQTIAKSYLAPKGTRVYQCAKN